MKVSTAFRLLVVAAALGLVSTAAIACGGSDQPDGIRIKGATTTASGASNGAATADTGPVDVSVTQKDNLFDPKNLTVPAGRVVRFQIKNSGQAIHNFHILSSSSEGKDYSGKSQISAGGTDTVEVTFKKTGVVKFQCDFHAPDMSGTITVR